MQRVRRERRSKERTLPGAGDNPGRTATGQLGRCVRSLLPLAIACTAGSAHARAANEENEAIGTNSDGEITVTGSRISGGRVPAVPLTVLGEEEINAQVPANLSDLVNQLPAITPGSTAGNSSGNLSNGLAGINSVNLRGLGVTRSLVLVDGRRTVGSAITGVVDVNTIPQALVRRVEVVTGGASAEYGSDAVGGVINFILDTDRRGLSLKADQGVAAEGDGAYRRFEATAGFNAFEGRLHVLFNADLFHQQGVSTIDRTWNGRGFFQINNPAYAPGNGAPERLVGTGVAPATYAPGGLVASGPLRGTYFGQDGRTGLLNYGHYAPAIGGWMVGGDTQTTLAGHLGTNSLIPDETREGLFNRTSIDLSEAISLFGQVSWNRYEGRSSYQQTPSTGLTIQSDNAYLRSQYPSVAANTAALGLNSLTIGTSNAGLPVPGSVNRRDVLRLLGGVEGRLPLFGRDWTWNASYQHGVTSAHEELVNVWNVARMSQAQDAVVAGGRIVCRSSLGNPLDGCVPIDRLGLQSPSSAALSYIYGDRQPQRDERIRQDVASIGASGALLRLPGGEAKLALGAEWRREGVSSSVDPNFRSNWLYGNYQPASGHYTVREAYAELEAPLLPAFGLNGAARVTDYSTSGTVATWKTGAIWSLLDGLELRGTYSRDIRAPNLSDLFAGATSRTNTVILPANAPISGAAQMLEQTLSNPDLAPERARSWTAGLVLKPRFAPDLSFSFDYFATAIRDAIGAVSAQTTVNLCYSGATVYCPNLIFSNGALSSILVRPVNFASQRERGLDVQGSYRTALSMISRGLPGTFSINALVTHYIANIIDNGVFPVDYAGVNGDSTFGSPAVPRWSYRASAFLELAPATLNIVVRGLSSGVYGNDFVECTSNCPTSSARYRTINSNHIAGATYLDASLRLSFPAGGRTGSFTLAATNLLNKPPVPVANGPDGNNWPAYAQTNRLLYDVVGRVIRASVSLNLR